MTVSTRNWTRWTRWTTCAHRGEDAGTRRESRAGRGDDASDGTRERRSASERTVGNKTRDRDDGEDDEDVDRERTQDRDAGGETRRGTAAKRRRTPRGVVNAR